MNLTDSYSPDADRAAGDVIDGEAIIINLVTGAYYSMQGIGGEIWSMVTQQRSVASMLEHIVSSYDVSREQASADLEAVLGQLLSEGLIRPGTSADVPGSAAPGSARKAYRKPALQVFRDMEELLALDPPAPGMNKIAWSAPKSDPE
jgi:hypothetical protein